jgi:hypothetical protein
MEEFYMEAELREENYNYINLDNKKKIYNTQNKAYTAWRNMIERCNNEYYFPRYSDCQVCEEWYNYQNFAVWYHGNIYSVEDERMELDKDILVKGNRLYSPETCIFVPKRINLFFAHKSENEGVIDEGNWHRARIWDNKKKKSINLNTYETYEEAREVYKDAKRKQLELILEEYKYKLPILVWDAIASYKF